MTTHTLPGLIDAHVHLRNPGGQHKETVTSGTAAALAGGITAVLAMPNTSPPITDGLRLATARRSHSLCALCDVGLFVGATDNNASVLAACAVHACGLKIYYNDTFGPLRIERLSSMLDHFATWPTGKPIVLHAEETAVATAIGLAETYGQHVHIAHVSRADEIRLIASAKDAGLHVTCEVAPHHLFLTVDDAERLGAYGKMQPPLATAADREALWAHMGDIDCIATDHAPHTRDEKDGAEPPPGVPGLETSLPLMLTAVDDGRLTLDDLVLKTSTNPAHLFNISTPDESSVEVEVGPEWTLPESGYQTKPDWSPFAGQVVRARVVRTTLRDNVAWEEGEIKVMPGTGQMLF